MANRYHKFVQPADGIELISYAPGTGMPAAPQLTPRDFESIVQRIQPIFAEVAGRFDSTKFPQDVYVRIRAAFTTPATVTRTAIREALRWKYGHLRKSGIPAAHEKLIADVQRAWPQVAKGLPAAPDQGFKAIDKLCGGRTRFITAAFLSHLVFPDKVPIIDQHNFRAVNAFLHDARPMWLGRKRPTKWEDIVAVGKFMAGILSAWNRLSPTTVPTSQRLDHFLMMYGKALKLRHNSRLQPTPAGRIIGRRG
jgi:hypothetical protein